jgi:hypothetical protein
MTHTLAVMKPTYQKGGKRKRKRKWAKVVAGSLSRNRFNEQE